VDPGAIAAAASAVLALSIAPPTAAPTPARSVSGHVLPAPVIENGVGVSFELSTCFWDPPPSGLLPVRVEARNAGTRPREYTASFNATGGYHRYGTSYRSSHVMPLPAGARRRFELLVPVRAGAPASGLPHSLQLSLDGPGSSPESLSLFMNNYYLHSGTGHRAHTPWVGLSESLATAYWEQAKTLLGSRDSLLLVGSRFGTTCLPADWRSYVGFEALGLTADEWRDLAPEARTGIERWIARGGRLWLAGGPAAPRRLGFGEIQALPPRESWTMATLPDAVVGLRGAPIGDYGSWSLSSELGTPELPKGLMLTFIAGFALMVGPVNLFGFCRGQNRHRIFWTTPLISTAASLGLGTVILLQDGVGGRGQRLVLVGLLPDRHEEVVLQEQLSRTGLLLGSRFTTPEAVWIEPLDTDAERRSQQLQRTGDAFAGEWFVSRALQGQLVETVRPSRARLELEKPAGQPPRLVSSVPATLAQVYYVDGDGRFWQGTGVNPGHKTELKPATEAQFNEWWAQTTAHHGPRLDTAATRAPGTIWAAAPGAKASVATLGSIAWRDHDTLYVQRGL
jgi:hypothetical protein